MFKSSLLTPSSILTAAPAPAPSASSSPPARLVRYSSPSPSSSSVIARILGVIQKTVRRLMQCYVVLDQDDLLFLTTTPPTALPTLASTSSLNLKKMDVRLPYIILISPISSTETSSNLYSSKELSSS